MNTDTTRDKVESELRALLTERFEVPAELITPQAHVFGDLGLDSVDLMSAVAIMEERHQLTVSDEDLENLLVIGGIIDHFTELLERT